MTSRELEAVATAICAMFAGIIIGAISVLATGYAASIFWNMAMPELFDLPTASVRNGIGLAGLVLCVNWMFGSSISLKKE